MSNRLQQTAKNLKAVRKGLKFKGREIRALIKRRCTSAKVISVTGSSGKTTTCALIKHILEADSKVLSQILSNKYKHTVGALLAIEPDDKYIVLEQGTEAPGGLEKPTHLARPDIAIVTLVAIEHYAAFRSIEAVATEKATLVRNLARSGIAILNFDDPNVRAMADLANGRTATYGTTGGDYVVSNVATSDNGFLSFNLKGRGHSLALKTHLIGDYNWLSVAAATVCALELGLPSSVIKSRIASFVPVRGRMSFHEVADGTKFILDTAKAPLHSLPLSFGVLKSIKAPKKRIVLGQISDFAGNSTRKYRTAYVEAARIADEVCFVGPWSHKARAPASDVESGKFRAFPEIRALTAYLKESATKGEVILVKSARNMHLERLMLDRVENVLCWPNECGVGYSCVQCGLFAQDFREHGGKNPNRAVVAAPRSCVID